MKNTILLIAFLFIANCSFSQALSANSSGNIFDADGNKWTVTEARDILYTNPKALQLYEQGREKKTWGNVLLYGGLGLTLSSLAYYSRQDINATYAPTIIGLGMVIVGIPVKIGHSKKVKKAIELYNESLATNTTSVPIKITLTASQQQIGFKYQF